MKKTADIFNKLDATVIPAATDDSSKGFQIGSKWVDTTGQNVYECISAAAGAAIWIKSNYVHPNHTGEVTSTGDGATVAQPTIISNKTTLGSLSGTEEFLINDGGVLKKVLASNVGGGDTIFTGGTMSAPSTITMANNDLRFTGGSTSFGAVIDPQSKLVLQAEGETYALRVNKSGGALNVLIRDDGGIMMQNDVTIGSFIPNAAGLFVANGTNSTRLRVDTDSGAFTFVVQKNGNVYASPNYNTNGAVGIGVSPNTSLGGNPYLKIASKGAANNILGVYKDGVSTPSLFVDSGENVGIGTATPTAKLHVKGINQLGTSTALLVQDGAGTPNDLLKVANDGSTTINGDTEINGDLTINDGVEGVNITTTEANSSVRIQGGTTTGTHGVRHISILGNVGVANIGQSSIGIGESAESVGNRSIAIGFNSSSDTDSLAVGNSASVVGSNGVAIGASASVNNTNSGTAVGTSCSVTADFSSAFGSSSTVNGASSTAVGRVAQALGGSNTAIGTTVTTSSGFSTAVGNTVTSSNNRATGIGSVVTASGAESMALGMGVSATATKSIVIGNAPTLFGAPTMTMTNNIANSIFLGANSDTPSLFIGGGDGTIGSTGNIGVGTTTPTAKLQVKGINQLGTSTALLVQDGAGTPNDLLKVANDGSTTINGELTVQKNGRAEAIISATNNTSEAVLQFKHNGVAEAYIQSYPSSFSIAYLRERIAFFLPDLGSVYAIDEAADIKWNFANSGVFVDTKTQMRLTKDSLILGNGIGALPTNAKLHVKGSDNLGTSTALLVEDSSGSDLLRVFNDGNVGIGINGITPAAKLHVKGTGTTSGTTALLVQNSTPAELFKITDDGSLFTVGFQGFTGTGAYTNFTIKNGIITAAS